MKSGVEKVFIIIPRWLELGKVARARLEMGAIAYTGFHLLKADLRRVGQGLKIRDGPALANPSRSTSSFVSALRITMLGMGLILGNESRLAGRIDKGLTGLQAVFGTSWYVVPCSRADEGQGSGTD